MTKPNMKIAAKAAKFVLAVAFAATVFWQPASAHDDVANPGKAQHGGIYTEFEVHHGIELVADDAQLVFHMTEHLKPTDMTGSAFRAVVQNADGVKVLPLQPDGSTLVGKLDAPLPAGTTIALSGKDSDGNVLQAKFVTQ